MGAGSKAGGTSTLYMRALLKLTFHLTHGTYARAVGSRGKPLTPHNAGYQGYPTATEILNWVDATGVVKDKVITLHDMNMLLDLLVFDRRLERMGNRKPQAKGGTTEAGQAPEAMNVDDEDEYDAKEDDVKDEDEEEQDLMMYRFSRRADVVSSSSGAGNGYTEVPCTTCPVSRICGDGGPVSARSCVYFEKWLAA